MVADASDRGRRQKPSQRWASPWDWAAHRDTITRLYMAEGLPLSEVARVMSRDHGFHSSQRMFKDRFQRWGLHKYHSNRNSSQSVQASTRKATSSARNSPALPLGLEPPETLRIPEAIVQLTEVLAASELAGAFFPRQSYDSFAVMNTSAWCRDMRSSATLIALGEHHEGFRALNQCLDGFRRLLQTPSLDLFAQLFVVLLVLPPEIARRFLVFVANMASISLPSGHPLRLMWATLKPTGYRGIWDNAWLILWSHIAVLKRRLAITHPAVLNLYTELSDNMMLLHHERRLRIDLDVFAAEQRALIKARQAVGDDFNMVLAQLCLGFHSWRSGDLAAAEAIAQDVLARCSASPDGSALKRLVRYAVEIQWRVAMDKHDGRRALGSGPLRPGEMQRLFDEALRLGRETARLQLMQLGRHGVPVGETVAEMRAFCQKAGRSDSMNSVLFL